MTHTSRYRRSTSEALRPSASDLRKTASQRSSEMRMLRRVVGPRLRTNRGFRCGDDRQRGGVVGVGGDDAGVIATMRDAELRAVPQGSGGGFVDLVKAFVGVGGPGHFQLVAHIQSVHTDVHTRKGELRLICHRCGEFYRTPILSMLCPPCAGSQRRPS